MSDELRINGNVHSWGSIVLKIGDARITGITSISYGDSRPREKVYGMGRSQAPRGRTRGKYEPDPMTMTVWKATGDLIRKTLAEQGGGTSFGDTRVEVVVQYIEGSEVPMTDTLEECVYVKATASSEEGGDGLSEDIEWDVMRINWNGRTLHESENS